MIIEIVILILAIPTGVLIAYLAKDELVTGRKWFLTLMIVSFLLGVLFYFLNYVYIALTAVFIFVVSLISYWKSFDRNWTKKRQCS